MGETILQDTTSFIKDLFENLGSGILFFGGPFDIVLAILDILITTLVIYYLLKLIRDSRAWQLLKGILLIIILSQLFTLLGFQTIGFILSSTLSVLAIAFVVLFQPELRRALETVGRNSFNLLSGMIAQDADQTRNARYSMIDAIVRATAQMAETHTGALIIIERDTKLGELAEQDNAVIMDSMVSASMLMQIFYKGSPLHDGAVLIRDGRINAARCHVPLSDNYHLRRDYGTRHRAAIGVSEMGDAIAIAVSEERGVVSIAINGRLYTLDNPDALRTILHRQLGVRNDSSVIAGIFKNKKRRNRQPVEVKPASAHAGEALNEYTDGDITTFQANNEAGEKTDIPYRRKWLLEGTDSVRKIPRKNKILLLTSSMLIAVFLWLYILITVNPVETKEFTVSITTQGVEELAARDLQLNLSAETIKVNVAGRSKNLKNLSSGDIEAVVDVSDIVAATTFTVTINAKVRKLSYFEIRAIYPTKITAVISNSDG
ncbi:MAG: diadenylate cyclase CdaA [Saccharofermentanales bacterium]